MPRLFWKSLRSRILLLAVLTCLFLGGAAVSFFGFLRSNHAATLAVAEQHLENVAAKLARNYSEQVGKKQAGMKTAVVSLRAIERATPPHPGAGPMPPPPLPPPPPPGSVSNSAADDSAPRGVPIPDGLAELTAEVLREEPGIEGGFYAAESGAMPGYAFPTHEGPGGNKEMPQRERPVIENLVREAVESGGVKTFRFDGPHDAVLFVALPVRESSVEGKETEITGAVWLMERMPGINGGRNRQLLLGSIGFITAALVTAMLALFVTTEVRSGVNVVLARLGSLEGGFPAPRQALTAQVRARPELDEFDRVLRGIDVLAASLEQKIENERALEAQVRHKERLSALGQFAAGVAHELRNPLATIRLRTQMSQRAGGDEIVARNSKVILEEIDRLDTIIGRLLYFARPIQLQQQLVAVDELCASVAASWSERSGIKIGCEADSNAVVLCDRSRMMQVLDNLMENAVHSAGPGGRVEIEATVDGGFAQIKVLDDGAGFEAGVLSRALDPFFTTKESGTGLGLSISFEIVQAHGGELQLGNRSGGGAFARIRLPLAEHSHSEREMLSLMEDGKHDG